MQNHHHHYPIQAHYAGHEQSGELGEAFLLFALSKARSTVKLSNGAKQCGARENQTRHELFNKNVKKNRVEVIIVKLSLREVKFLCAVRIAHAACLTHLRRLKKEEGVRVIHPV